MSNFSLEFDLNSHRRLQGREFKVIVEQVENDSYIASILHNGSTVVKDDVGALYYVIAVIFIYGCSILMMIASYIRKNKADRKLNKYLKEMAHVRKREVLYATARTANKLEQFKANHIQVDYSTRSKASGLQKPASVPSLDPYFNRSTQSKSRFGITSDYVNAGKAVRQKPSTDSSATYPQRSASVRSSRSAACLDGLTAKRQAFRLRHSSLDKWISESCDTEDERYLSETDVKFSISPINSEPESPPSPSPFYDIHSSDPYRQRQDAPISDAAQKGAGEKFPSAGESSGQAYKEVKTDYGHTSRGRKYKYALLQEETNQCESPDGTCALDTICPGDIIYSQQRNDSPRMKYERLLRQNLTKDLVISAV